MPLPSSGELSMMQMNVELGASPTSPLSLGHPDLRIMTNNPSIFPQGSTISFADLRGKSYFTYEVYQQSVINSGWAGTRRWVHSHGFKIVVNNPPGLIVQSLVAFDEAGAILFNSPFKYTQRTDDWNILVKPSIVTQVDQIDQSCIQNPQNWVIVAPYVKSGNWRSVTIHKFAVVMSNGILYELRNHRNFSFGYPYLPDKAFSQDDFFRQDSYTGVLVPPNA